jgi:hypothetical protein
VAWTLQYNSVVFSSSLRKGANPSSPRNPSPRSPPAFPRCSRRCALAAAMGSGKRPASDYPASRLIVLSLPYHVGSSLIVVCALVIRCGHGGLRVRVFRRRAGGAGRRHREPVLQLQRFVHSSLLLASMDVPSIQFPVADPPSLLVAAFCGSSFEFDYSALLLRSGPLANVACLCLVSKIVV